MIYQGEKTVAENAEKLDDAQKQALEECLADAKQDLESDDSARIATALQRLQAELHKLAETLYKAEAASGESGASGPGASGPGEASGPADDDVIDAEYTEEKES